MKKLKKNFVALIMALTMAVSFSTVAFAAKAEESINIGNNQVTVERSDIDTASVTVSKDYYSDWYSGNKRTTYTIPFTLPSDGYLKFVVSSDTGIRVTLYKDGANVGKAYYMEKDGAGTTIPIVKNGTLYDNLWTAGNYTAKVEVLFDYHYVFRIYSSAKI